MRARAPTIIVHFSNLALVNSSFVSDFHRLHLFFSSLRLSPSRVSSSLRAAYTSSTYTLLYAHAVFKRNILSIFANSSLCNETSASQRPCYAIDSQFAVSSKIIPWKTIISCSALGPRDTFLFSRLHKHIGPQTTFGKIAARRADKLPLIPRERERESTDTYMPRFSVSARREYSRVRFRRRRATCY